MKKIKIFGDWAVTSFGVVHLGRIPYEIHKSRVWESAWERHMAEKNWVFMPFFEEAIAFAREYFKKEVDHG
jgi:hypothetical protein